jgi:hypothetical protein
VKVKFAIETFVHSRVVERTLVVGVFGILDMRVVAEVVLFVVMFGALASGAIE